MKIEKSIPLPSPKKKPKAQSKYPFKLMHPGDSVFFADQINGGMSKPAKAANEYGRRNGMKFISRAIDGGVRIWRVE